MTKPFSQDIKDLSIHKLQYNFRQQTFTALDATNFCLKKIQANNKHLNAFITITENDARIAAEASDNRRRNGRTLGALDGIPIAIKDNINLKGTATTNGIGAYRGGIAKEDANIIKKIKNAGGIILGKTNMDEAALGASNRNHAYGFCQNPHKTNYTSGGSSGGSAVAVAAGLCTAAIGSDTLGSIRIPASFCGVLGLKPSYNSINTNGIIELYKPLDHIGPFANNPEDLLTILEIITDTNMKSEPVQKQLTDYRIGFIKDINTVYSENLDPEVFDFYSALKKNLIKSGHHISDVNWDHIENSVVLPKAILLIEVALAKKYKKKLTEYPDGFSSEIKAAINFGLDQDTVAIRQARKTITNVKEIIKKALYNYDLLITPTTLAPAFPLNKKMPRNITSFTAFANYTGYPALSVPVGKTKNGLPMGFQIIGKPECDREIIRFSSEVLSQAH